VGRWREISWRTGAAAVLALVVAGGGLAFWRVQSVLRSAANEVAAEHRLSLQVRTYLPAANPGFEWVGTPGDVVRAASFQGYLYLAGATGLLEYDEAGILQRQFRAGQELPPSPVVDLATGVLADSREPELLLATAAEGVLAFNGRQFRQIRPDDEKLRRLSALLVGSSGRLLLGTVSKGVLLYDGRRLAPLHASLSDIPVTALAGTESDLWVGTRDRGVLHWHAGGAETFSEEAGLPDRQVLSLATHGNKTYVGTPVGTAEFEDGHFVGVLASGAFALSLWATDDRLLIGTLDQGLMTVALSRRHMPTSNSGLGNLQDVRQIVALGDAAYAVTRSGVYAINGSSNRPLIAPPPTGNLTDRNIAALATDQHGQLWVGYFDRGLDLLRANGSLAVHVENEHVFCVNRIVPDAKEDRVHVATANGLVEMDASGAVRQVLTRSDGLIADHVTDAVAYRGGLAVATPAGLTFLDATGPHSLYAFHGLVNNHVYTLAAADDELLAGTLGGISVLEKGDVRSNYTAGVSGLKHNWVTALVRVGEEWMVGTYGAGVLRLRPDGRFAAMDRATAALEINPNAMLVTPQHVLAGTLGRGLLVYDRSNSRWDFIEAGLPSRNVTALAVRDGVIYVGTDNGLVRITENNLHP
jgi:hypothetical protein